MKGYVFHGPGQSAWQEVPDPAVKDATDAIVRVDAVTICGTDLHILKGDVPEVRPGTVLGHEAVGEIVETGGDVRTVRPGDRVLVSCITALVDRIDDALSQGWSVLVRGTARAVTEPDEARRLEERAYSMPWVGGRRDVWVRIDPVGITGRRIESR
ncbi:alcohol dehydrogenase catalytic domain-containing protein [Streptomyces sp. NPDC047706]|uniref:alcohol dehydrogenase catalytic domain-containing protein n=1 Tax=Streptomyces sp. NPDC047706 TaxID=3365486 RepID=UPI0037183492